MEETPVEPERPPRTPYNKRHRSKRLVFLGLLSCLCGVMTCFLCIPFLGGVIVGLSAAMMARRDLQRIERGDMDPAGKETTQLAQTIAVWGIVLNVCGALSFRLAQRHIAPD